jgi:hypothetical protein
VELTSEAKCIAKEFGTFSAGIKDNFAHYLLHLADCRPYQYWLQEKYANEEEVDKRQNSVIGAHTMTRTQFFHREKTIEALQHIGLDFRGGLVRLHRLRNNIIYAKLPCAGFPMQALIVTDPEKARRYINIGVEVNATTLMHQNPTTLEEAVNAYSLILSLTSPNNESPRTVKGISEEISEATDTDLIWELKREKFILDVRDRYREVVADMVMEEKVCLLPFLSYVPILTRCNSSPTSTPVSKTRSDDGSNPLKLVRVFTRHEKVRDVLAIYSFLNPPN